MYFILVLGIESFLHIHTNYTSTDYLSIKKRIHKHSQAVAKGEKYPFATFLRDSKQQKKFYQKSFPLFFEFVSKTFSFFFKHKSIFLSTGCVSLFISLVILYTVSFFSSLDNLFAFRILSEMLCGWGQMLGLVHRCLLYL